MKDIAIFGAGGFGREVACLIKRINEKEPTWNFLGFYDDDTSLGGSSISHYGPYLGTKDALNALERPLSVVIAIGNPAVVKNIFESIKNENISFPNLMAPETSIVDPISFKIGIGNIIQKDCHFSCDVEIGDFNVFNGWVAFGHDDKVGSFNTFMPDVKVSGEVTIGNNNFFGVGSIVLQQIKISDDIRLGAGSVLMTKPRPGNLYIGNPAVKFKFK